MIEAISGDFIFNNTISDKTIVMVGTIEHLLTKKDLYLCLKKWYNKYPNLDYGINFKNYIKNGLAYDSYGILGNIRIIPYIKLDLDLNKLIELSLINSKSTHMNSESEKGTIALMTVLYMAKHKYSKEDIYKELSKFYDLNFHIKDIDNYKDEPSCINIIPISIVIFLESNSYRDCIKKCIHLKYNLNSNAIISGSLIYLYYKKFDDKALMSFYQSCPIEIYDLIVKFINKY